MNNPKHTKGPWDVESAPMSDTLNCNPVAYFIKGHYIETITRDERLANERLIAAAPDLLEALDKLVTRVANDEKISKHDEGLHRCISLIRKATGESND